MAGRGPEEASPVPQSVPEAPHLLPVSPPAPASAAATTGCSSFT